MSDEQKQERPEWAQVAENASRRAQIREEFPDIARLLDFEQAHPDAVTKDSRIRAEMRVAPARYYQLLGRFIETQAALEYAPVLVKRLLEQRDHRRGVRAARYQPITTKG